MLDHEKLQVYRLAIEFIGWVGWVAESLPTGTRAGALRHLEDAAQSIANNIAEGNGKRSMVDRCRFLDISRGSALECAACVDGLVARRRLSLETAKVGKGILVRIVAMLSRLIERLLPPASTSTSGSTSTSTSTSTSGKD